jgi:hypothetical protein
VVDGGREYGSLDIAKGNLLLGPLVEGCHTFDRLGSGDDVNMRARVVRRKGLEEIFEINFPFNMLYCRILIPEFNRQRKRTEEKKNE